MPNVRRGPVTGSAISCALALATVPAAALTPSFVPMHDSLIRADALLDSKISSTMGVDADAVVQLPTDLLPGAPMVIDLPLNGEWHTAVLLPHSVRSPDAYQVLAQQPDGTYVEHEPGPIQTLRGTIWGLDGSVVAGSMLEDGLHLMIAAGDTYWVQPVADEAEASPGAHIVYTADDVHPTPTKCGVKHELDFDAVHNEDFVAGVLPLGGACIAELACDADTEYFNDYGSVANVEARINSIINTVNLQYESQVGISHQITTIVVRTGTDPYTFTDAQDRLCQFITEWTNNQQDVQRDVAHLFTGAELAGSDHRHCGRHR